MVKKTKAKVKRKNGRIAKGSGSNGGGRPKGSKSTGKKPAIKSKTNLNKNTKKPALSTNKSIKSASKKHTSSAGKKTGVKRNRKGQVQRGSAGLPGAGRKTGNSKSDRLEQYISEVSAEPKNKEWLKDLIRRSYHSESLSIALLNKLYPSLKAVELTQPQEDPDAKKAAARIRKMMQERMKPAKTIAELEAEIEKIRVKQLNQQNDTGGRTR